MTNEYYEHSPQEIEPGTTARANDVNAVGQAMETGMDKLPTEAELKDGTIQSTTDTGAVNAYVVAMTYPRTAYADGQKVEFKPANTNTTEPCTINVDGLGAKSIKRSDGTDPTIGDIVAGNYITLIYESTSGTFIVQSSLPNTVAEATDQAGYSEEWATKAEDSLVSTAAGGDGETDYSALHHAAKGASSASAAASSASGASAAQTAAETAQTGAETAQTASETAQTAAELAETNSETAQAASETAQGLSETAQAASETAQGLSETAQAASEAAQGLSETAQTAAELAETNAETAEANAVTAQTAAETAQTGAELAETNAETAETNAETSETNSAASEVAAGLSEDAAALSAASAATVAARNAVQNQPALSQGESTDTGMSATIYTGNGTSQSVDTGLDMLTGDFGGFVWVKNRDTVNQHILADTIRGTLSQLNSATTAVESAATTTVTAFTSTGIDVGAASSVNGSTNDLVAWSFQTNKKVTGVTNRNKAYTSHYNADMGFSIVGYVGDGIEGHEIPHHLGAEPELSIFKNRDGVTDWGVQGSYIGDRSAGDFLKLNLTDVIANAATFASHVDDATLSLGTSITLNTSTENYISYHFRSIEGVSKVGRYSGTGAAGKYVDCGFKPAFVMVKNLDLATSWIIYDGMRGDGFLIADASDVEGAFDSFDFVEDGFVAKGSTSTTNQLNDEYIFLAFAETNIDATKAWTDFTYPTTADTLSFENGTLISVADGFNASGQVDTQFESSGGITLALGVGFESQHLHIYSSKTGTLGATEHRPLVGWNSRNAADKWGEVSPLDASLRTTAKHFDYESETGVALASGEVATYEAYQAFTKTGNPYAQTDTVWLVATTTNSQLQYKQNEKRILKSWRFREGGASGYAPKRFTIEGSDDGYTWTALDSSYASADYTGNGIYLWGDLEDASANTTAYLYHRINITANNGDGTYTSIAELEFNTILPADYYLVQDGKMYDSTGTPIERTYLGEVDTNSDGEIIQGSIVNHVAVEKKGSAEYQGDVKVHGELINSKSITAWVRVDGLQNPPLISASSNIIDVVDLGTGKFKIIPADDLDVKTIYGTVTPNASIRQVALFDYEAIGSIQVYSYDHTNTLADAKFTAYLIGGRSIK